MAIAFLILGAGLIVAAIRNTYGTLGSLLAGDFTGSNSFLYWIALLVIIGGLGMVPALRNPSRMLLGLIIIAYLLKDGTGFWSHLQSALSAGPTAEPASATTLQTPSGGVPITLSTGSSSPLSTATSAIPLVGQLINL